MKIFVISKNGDAAGLCHQFKREKHDVSFYIEDKELRDSMENIIPHVGSINEGLVKGPDLVLFDREGNGKLADQLKKQGFPVCCASATADKMELDRQFGIDLMEKNGIKVPKTEHFGDVKSAIAYVEKNSKAYAVKLDGNKGSASSYVSKDAADMIDYLKYQDEMGLIEPGCKFVLQDVVKGVEISTEVWFSNGKPIGPYNSTFETKKFIPGDLGPNTGCETSAVFYYAGASQMVKKTTAKIFHFLEREKWTGPLDINCIVSEKDHEPYGLEWTVRLGYSAIYALAAMMGGGVAEFFHDLAHGKLSRVPVKNLWGTSLRMSIPPYPFDDPAREKLERELFSETAGIRVKAPDSPNWWPLDIKKDAKGRIVTAGIDGTVGECTGAAPALETAWKISQKVFDEVQCPNKQGRYIDGIERATESASKMKGWGYDVPDAKGQSKPPMIFKEPEKKSFSFKVFK